jgi:hypothetical protein
MKLDESMKGMDVSGLQKMELLRTTMDRIRVAPDRQKALESAVNEFGKNVRQSGMNR